jgi:2TM domain
MNPENLDRIARKRAGAKLGFYIHAAVFVVVNLALFVINGQATPARLWFFWPLGGWGIGLAFHGLAVFLLASGSGLRERMVQAERRRLESQSVPGQR